MSKSAFWLLPKLYTLIYYKFIINYKWYILFPIHNLEFVWLTYYLVSHLVIIQNGVVIQITTGFKFLYDQFLAVGSDAGWDILNKVCLTERQELEWVNVRLRAVCSTLYVDFFLCPFWASALLSHIGRGHVFVVQHFMHWNLFPRQSKWTFHCFECPFLPLLPLPSPVFLILTKFSLWGYIRCTSRVWVPLRCPFGCNLMCFYFW